MLVNYWLIPSENGKAEFKQEHGFEEDLVQHTENGMPLPRITVAELDQIGLRIGNGQTRCAGI